MKVRELESDDVDAVRRIARNSLEASYAHTLDDATIDAAVQDWYTRDELEAAITDDRACYLVAEDEAGEVAGFVQGRVSGDRGTVHWLHVDPDRRGEGVGSRLLTLAADALNEAGAATVRGEVLEVNEAGVAFYEDHGYERTADREVEIGDQTFVELVFEDLTAPAPELEPWTAPDGTTYYVDYTDADRGSHGEFAPAYADPEGETLYGWFCVPCETIDTAMDSMERIECNQCGSVRKAKRWDAAYL